MIRSRTRESCELARLDYSRSFSAESVGFKCMKSENLRSSWRLSFLLCMSLAEAGHRVFAMLVVALKVAPFNSHAESRIDSLPLSAFSSSSCNRVSQVRLVIASAPQRVQMNSIDLGTSVSHNIANSSRDFVSSASRNLGDTR